MRVLLRDQSDNTYIVLDAESVYYDESDQELYVVSENGETNKTYTITKS